MKCPKCGFFGPDYSDTCKKCGKDLKEERGKLGLTSFRTQRQVQKKEPPIAPNFSDELISAPPRPKPPDEIKPRTEPIKPKIVPPPLELKTEKAKKDFDLSQPPSGFRLDEEEKPFMPSAEEESFDLKSIGEDIGSSKDALDDFKFPDFTPTEPPISAVPVSEELPLPGKPPEVKSGEEEMSLSLDEFLAPETKKKEERGTELISPKELEDILQLEISRSEESQKKPIIEKSGTQLLDEDEISKLLENLKLDSSEPDQGP